MSGELYCPTCETSFDCGELCPRDGGKLVKLVPQADALLGKELDGRFTILEKLGAGGMGAVYRASQHSVNREVAVKVVHANLVSDPAVIKRFLREAKLASKLSHPNAVSVMDFGQTEDGLFYLVMELLEGTTLDEVLETTGVFDARRLLRTGIQVCEALEAANALQIIHRDLKPSNIMLLNASARDFVKVLDFGLAKSLENDSASQMTGSGNMIGTPAYMPPERACGESGDVRSDLYSLGCILYLLGSGRLPFDAPAVQDLLLKQVMEPAPPMTGVPVAVADVIDRLLKKSPAERYQTASETRMALEAALESLPSRSGSQPSIVVIPAHPMMTMASSLPSPVPVRQRLKSAAMEALEQGDTMGAPVPAAITGRFSKLVSRRRWAVAGAATALAALITFFAVVAQDPAGAAEAATLPAPTMIEPVAPLSLSVTGNVERPVIPAVTVPTVMPKATSARPTGKPPIRRTTTPKRRPGALPF